MTENDPDLSILSDAALLSRLQAGQEKAATALYEKYALRLIKLAEKRSGQKLSRQVDAEDIVQSVFRTFFRRASRGHYEIPDGDELWKLLLVISLNKIRKKAETYHAAKRDISRTERIGDRQIAAPDEPREILMLTIQDLIRKLPPEHQGVIQDRICGYEVAEMAKRNQLSRRTVERVLQSFRKSLKEELDETNES